LKQGLHELTEAFFQDSLETLLRPKLKKLLQGRAPGHCMRILDLNLDLVERLTAKLLHENPEFQVFILDDRKNPDRKTPGQFISSTRLIELRNPLPNGELRPPLLIFLPPFTKASVEDSFGIATFEEVDLGDVYQSLAKALQEEIPEKIRGVVEKILAFLEKEMGDFSSLTCSRFLLTLKQSGWDEETIGAALYELCLIPDFQIAKNPESVTSKLRANFETVQTIVSSDRSDQMRVLELPLQDADFKKELRAFFLEFNPDQVKTWTRKIVLEKRFWKLSFDKWPLSEKMNPSGEIFLKILDFDLPQITGNEKSDVLSSLNIGERYLPTGQEGMREFTVCFQVEPGPEKISGLARFQAQIISRNGVIELIQNKSTGTLKNNEIRIKFSKLNRIKWEEGWYFIRVIALNQDDELIPLVDDCGETVSLAARTQDESHIPFPNESDVFFVPGQEGEVDFEPQQRAIPRKPSVEHALFEIRCRALGEGRDPNSVRIVSTSWKEQKEAQNATGEDFLEVKFGRDGAVHIPVSRMLKNIERRILQEPREFFHWNLETDSKKAGTLTPCSIDFPEAECLADLQTAREFYFKAVLERGEGMISQGILFPEMKELVFQYASKYEDALRFFELEAERKEGKERYQVINCLNNLLAMDSVFLRILFPKRETKIAALIGPTHPLRALWLTGWSCLGKAWIRGATQNPTSLLPAIRDSFSQQISNVHFPFLIPLPNGELLGSIDNIHPFWTLYAPSSESDPRGLIGEVCGVLGLSEPDLSGSLINGETLGLRIKKYLVQHPYIKTLNINVFNPGRAKLVSDVLIDLQKSSNFEDLHFQIRIFVQDPQDAIVGEALYGLFSPDSPVTAKEADVFSIPSNNPLFPKLRISVNEINSFSTKPQEFPAHISLLFDIFPPNAVEVAKPSRAIDRAPVHGLLQDFFIEYREDGNGISWTKQPRHSKTQPLPGGEEISELLGSLAQTISSATAIVGTGQAGLHFRPVLTLSLGVRERALLHQVHEVSDWVFTIDRNMGIEYFDHPPNAQRPDYLIDHTPNFGSHLGHRLVISSKSLLEIQTILKQTVENLGFSCSGTTPIRLLDQLRFLSGRIALKLISSINQRKEAVSLALTRLFLLDQGFLRDQILIPLDAHLDLFKALQKNADELGNEVSLLRTDLCLIDLHAEKREITCNLIEVKCYHLEDFSDYTALKQKIFKQLHQSEEVLRFHFDPQYFSKGKEEISRPDKLLKTHELVALLEFYLARSCRLSIIQTSSESEARFLLNTLENGYSLRFTKTGLIFDMEKEGLDFSEKEGDVEIHRIGRNLCKQLFDSLEIEKTGPKDGENSFEAFSQASFAPEKRDKTVHFGDSEEDDADEIAVEILDSKKPVEPVRQKPEEISNKINSGPMIPGLKSGPKNHAARPVEEKPVINELEFPENSKGSDQESPVPLLENDTNLPRKGVVFDILLGSMDESPQYGLLGTASGRKIALDLNQTHTISLFGVQGQGKSYSIGTIVEMATMAIPGLSELPKPLATVIFHFSKTQAYSPEFVSMREPNDSGKQLKELDELFQARPKGLEDIIILTPEAKIDERRKEFPDLPIFPLKFSSTELQAHHWSFLMGAVGNKSVYIRQVKNIMKSLRGNLTLEGLRNAVTNSSLPDQVKDLALTRLNFAGEYLDDSAKLGDFIKPGRLVIVDLRDEFIEKDEALGLFVVILQLVAEAKPTEGRFNKLVVFDEAHKYIESPDLVSELVEVVREMRHKGTSIVVASQDPPSVPISLIELSSQIILHRFNSPGWLKHIQKANTELGELTPEKMARLEPGEAYIWSNKATDSSFSTGVVKIRCRPRVTKHGGGTKTAI